MVILARLQRAHLSPDGSQTFHVWLPSACAAGAQARYKLLNPRNRDNTKTEAAVALVRLGDEVVRRGAQTGTRAFRQAEIEQENF